MTAWNFKDLTGKTFGKWKVIIRVENTKKNKTQYNCLCTSCGDVYYVIATALVSGRSTKCKHCGNKKHGGTFGGTKARLYRIWSNMRCRCSNQNVPEYKWYGGKGITICKEWDDFSNFEKWASTNGYDTDLTIDRIDGNKNYCPENCRWITQHAQAGNKPKKYTNFTGIFYRKYKTDSCKNRHYVARIENPNFFKYVGAYHTELEAAIARDLYLINNDLLQNHNGNFMSFEKLMYKEN